MSPTTKLHLMMRRLTIALGAAALIAVSFLVGQIVGRVPVEKDDLVTAGVNSCVTAIKASLVLLDEDSIGSFNEAEIKELRQLPTRCSEPGVLEGLEDQYPALLAALHTIGTDPS